MVTLEAKFSSVQDMDVKSKFLLPNNILLKCLLFLNWKYEKRVMIIFPQEM